MEDDSVNDAERDLLARALTDIEILRAKSAVTNAMLLNLLKEAPREFLLRQRAALSAILLHPDEPAPEQPLVRVFSQAQRESRQAMLESISATLDT
ncbi:hypothetical protein [Acetobacter nitrogenifigens]|uniref:Uncharacterized protein n=1 Tax=Acetobacter nitrogenifigens DSM 23921 = NBRC 105050 TaxID=1120919 RepID=A0A511XF34_9PROT|nr:hypothetical protein [Acetobacter nitrogenifigens]GEN61511.1 hypothetical protein ANI02nite_33950 [Acetobacter nitrogenifigens DSM 23921 = NBRC 105050]